MALVCLRRLHAHRRRRKQFRTAIAQIVEHVGNLYGARVISVRRPGADRPRPLRIPRELRTEAGRQLEGFVPRNSANELDDLPGAVVAWLDADADLSGSPASEVDRLLTAAWNQVVFDRNV